MKKNKRDKNTKDRIRWQSEPGTAEVYAILFGLQKSKQLLHGSKEFLVTIFGNHLVAIYVIAAWKW